MCLSSSGSAPVLEISVKVSIRDDEVEIRVSLMLKEK